MGWRTAERHYWRRAVGKITFDGQRTANVLARDEAADPLGVGGLRSWASGVGSTLGGAGRELPDHPASKSVADLHGASLPSQQQPVEALSAVTPAQGRTMPTS